MVGIHDTSRTFKDPFNLQMCRILTESIVQLTFLEHVILVCSASLGNAIDASSSRPTRKPRVKSSSSDACLSDQFHLVATSCPFEGYPDGVKIGFRGRSKESSADYPAQIIFRNLAAAREGVPPGTENLLEQILDENWALYITDRGIEKRKPCTTMVRPTTQAARKQVDPHRGLKKRKQVWVLSLNQNLGEDSTINPESQHCYESVDDFRTDFGQRETSKASLVTFRENNKTWSYLTGYDPEKLFKTDKSRGVVFNTEALAEYINLSTHTLRRGCGTRPSWHADVQNEQDWQPPSAMIGRPLPPSTDGFVVADPKNEQTVGGDRSRRSGSDLKAAKSSAATSAKTQHGAARQEASAPFTAPRTKQGSHGLPVADLRKADASESVDRGWYP